MSKNGELYHYFHRTEEERAGGLAPQKLRGCRQLKKLLNNAATSVSVTVPPESLCFITPTSSLLKTSMTLPAKGFLMRMLNSSIQEINIAVAKE